MVKSQLSIGTAGYGSLTHPDSLSSDVAAVTSSASSRSRIPAGSAGVSIGGYGRPIGLPPVTSEGVCGRGSGGRLVDRFCGVCNYRLLLAIDYSIRRVTAPVSLPWSSCDSLLW